MNQSKTQLGTVSVLSLAHLINDSYSNFLPPFLPFLIAATGFGYAKATFLVSMFTLSSSLLQPLLGYFIDKQGKSWLLYIGTFWMTVFLSLMGFTTHYWTLVLLAVLAGMGTAVFHPQASSLMGEVSGNRKGFMMSAFMAMGNLGFALSPLIFIPLLNHTGLKGTVYLLVPGVLVSVFLYKFARLPQKDVGPLPDRNGSPLKSLYRAGGEVAKLVIVIVLRSVAYTGLITILPSYFKISKHLSIITSGNLVSLMLIAGVAGGIAGGWVSDRVGRRAVIVMSLLLSTLAFFGFYFTVGRVSYILLALAGALLMGSFSVTVVAAQEIIPQSKGLASGITMGFSIGLGGLAVTLVGWFADTYGLDGAVKLLFAIPALAGIIGLFLKEKHSCIKRNGLTAKA